jgi:hypothetical protein
MTDRTTGVTDDLSELDEQRQASMADEGGASGAVMESENMAERERITPRRSRLSPVVPVAAALGLVGLALLTWSRVGRR